MTKWKVKQNTMVGKTTKQITLLFITLFILIIVGFLLLVIVHLIPIAEVDENIQKSTSILIEEGDYYSYSKEVPSSILDNYTDSIMLMIAGYNGSESIIDKVIYNYYVMYSDKQRTESLSIVDDTTIAETDSGKEKKTYEWYWHGYLVVLKPLLFFFSISEIRQINALLILSEIVFACYLLWKRNRALYCVPFLISIAFINPSTVSLSLTYSIVFHITIISMIAVLADLNVFHKNPIILFCITGVLVSYSDFLTYPIISLVFPLVIYTCLCDGKTRRFASIPGNIIGWGVGYFGMWASKWFLSTIITGQNHFIKGFERIGVRSADVYNDTPLGINAFMIRMQPFVEQVPYLLVSVAFLILLIALLIKYRNLERHKIYMSLIILCCSLLPVIWYAVSKQHSFLHNHFTYRTLAGSFLSIGCFLIPLLDADKIKKRHSYEQGT